MTYLISRFLIKVFAKLFWSFKTYNIDRVPDKGAVIIAGNHASYMDPPLVGCCVKRKLWFVARKTLFRNRFIGRYLRMIQAMPIDNKSADVGALKVILKKLKEGEGVVIFPEGTRSTDGELQDPKLGIGAIVLKTGVPVVPAYIQNSYDAWPRDSKTPKFGVKVKVYYGNLLQFNKIAKPSKEEVKEASERIMREVEALKEGAR